MPKIRKRISQCKNCQETLNVTDNYCPKCGQENHYHSYKLKDIWNDFLGSLFNFDGKVFYSLKNLAKHPGKLSSEYIDGKRIIQVPPFRLYFFSAFIFFLLFNYLLQDSLKIGYSNKENHIYEYAFKNNWVPEFQSLKTQDEKLRFLENVKDTTASHWKRDLKYKKPSIDSIYIEKDSIENEYKLRFNIPIQEDSLNLNSSIISSNRKNKFLLGYNDVVRLNKNQKSFDSLMQIRYPNFISRKLNSHHEKEEMKEFVDPTYKEIKESQSTNKIMQGIYYSLLFIVPFSAFFIFILNYNKRKNYFPSLILSLHLHSYSLLIIGLFSIINSFLPQPWDDIILVVMALYVLVYFYLSLKNFFKMGYLQSSFKFIILLSIYVFSIMMAIVVSTIIADFI